MQQSLGYTIQAVQLVSILLKFPQLLQIGEYCEETNAHVDDGIVRELYERLIEIVFEEVFRVELHDHLARVNEERSLVAVLVHGELEQLVQVGVAYFLHGHFSQYD